MWHSTGRFLALDHDFGLRAQEPSLITHVERAFVDLAADGEPAHWYTITETPGSLHSYEIRFDDEPVAGRLSASKAIAWAEWDANRRASASAAGAVLHAGAVQAGSGAVIVPGPSGAGKSTIVALLVKAGYRYLTDETVAFDSAGRVRPYPKPLALGDEARRMLQLDGSATSGALSREGKWLVPAQLLAGGGVGIASSPCLVLVIARAPGAAPSVERLTPGETLLALGRQAVTLRGQGPQTLDFLRALAAKPGFRVTADNSLAIVRLSCQVLRDHGHG